MANMFKPLWAYRGFIWGSITREFQVKYRNSMLGAAWTVLNPLAMIFIYTVVFSQVMKTKLPGVEGIFSYSIYLCAGITTWGLFTEIASRAQNIFLEHANLLKKLSFPRLCLPTVVIFSAVINFFIIFGLFTLFLLLTGNFPGWAYIAIFPLLLIQIVFAIGLGITLGVLNVFFRDVGQFFGILLTFWFWLTPIVYSPVILPAEIKELLGYNPMAPLITAFHSVMVAGHWPEWTSLIYPSIFAIVFCSIGFRLFRKHSADMVDEL